MENREKAKPKPTQPATALSKELIREFEGIEIPSQDLGGTDDDLDKIVSAYGEEVKEEEAVLEEDEESDENEENQPPIEDTELPALDEKGGVGVDTQQDQDDDEKRISKRLQEQFMEEKRLREAEKAERKRLKEEARAQKKQLKEQRKAEAAAAKEGKQEDGEKRARRKKKKVISTELGEGEGETEETEEEVVDDASGDEIINEEDLDEESSTASSSISIDPDLEVVSSSEILGEDEYWEVIEIEEESLDDEEQKVIRKIKKRVKRKLEKKTDELDKSTSKELTDAKKSVMESGDEEQAMAGSTSVEGLQGRQREEVRVSGIINLQPDRDDIVSVVSEPEHFEISFAHVPGIGPTVSENQIKAVIKYMSEWASKQGGYIMPRNIRHFLCPPLDAECKNDDSLSGASSVKSNKGNKSE